MKWDKRFHVKSSYPIDLFFVRKKHQKTKWNGRSVWIIKVVVRTMWNIYNSDILFLNGSFKKYVHWGEEGGSLKSKQKRTGGGGPSICVRSHFLNYKIFKMKFYSYSPVFPMTIMAVWNIKQTIVKDWL